MKIKPLLLILVLVFLTSCMSAPIEVTPTTILVPTTPTATIFIAPLVTDTFISPTVTESFIPATNANEQPSEYRVDEFSEDYYGVVHAENNGDFFKKGWVAIYDKKSDKELIKVSSDRIYFDLHEGKIKANILELPYGEQSLIVYDDFNFDNIKDFAIQDGLDSCYGGPSFNIYLSLKEKFVLNKDFTKLGHGYCGMFQVDKEQQKIYTMTKSGCCWHQYSEFIIENNIPTIKKIITDDVNKWIPPYKVLTIQEWNNGEMTERIERRLSWGDVKNYATFSFDLKNDDGKIILFNKEVGVGTLNYVNVAKDERVIFSFPIEKASNKEPAFLYLKEPSKIILRFTDNNTEYEIYEEINGNTINNIGVRITTNGNTTLLEGSVATIQGNLMNIERRQWNNVVVNK